MNTDPQRTNVVAYTGHRLIMGDLIERQIVTEMTRVLDEKSASFGIGSLCWGADILWAERLLARGAELHLVFPCQISAFLRDSLNGPGMLWTHRFWNVQKLATSVTIVRDENSASEEGYREASDRVLAMATATSRERKCSISLGAVWDGERPCGIAGTAVDVMRWSALGYAIDVVSPHGARYVPAAKQ